MHLRIDKYKLVCIAIIDIARWIKITQTTTTEVFSFYRMQESYYLDSWTEVWSVTLRGLESYCGCFSLIVRTEDWLRTEDWGQTEVREDRWYLVTGGRETCGLVGPVIWHPPSHPHQQETLPSDHRKYDCAQINTISYTETRDVLLPAAANYVQHNWYTGSLKCVIFLKRTNSK